MSLTVTTEQALSTRAPVEGYPVHKRDYIVRAEGETAPIAFLVEQGPNEVIAPHFHTINQFQVIVHGGGKLGRRDVSPATVQYADAYTGYGPIVSEDDGIFYFTLRPRSGVDTRPWYLPESKDKQRERDGRPRNRVGHVPDGASPVRGARQREVIASEDDGLRADEVRLEPGGVWSGWPEGNAGGSYVLVLNGTARIEGCNLDRWSCAFFEHDETPSVEAGPAGVQFVAMRFPVGQ